MSNKPKPTKSNKSNPIDKYLFDDRPICQAVKRADADGRSLTLSELKRAFKKVKTLLQY